MTPSDPRDPLTSRLLKLDDQARQPEINGDHPDPELLAAFAAGQLSGDERQTVLAHVADCSTCRAAVAAVLAELAADEARATPSSAVPSPGGETRRDRRASLLPWLAAAAALLLVAGWLVTREHRDPEAVAYLEARQALVAGRFDEVHCIVARDANETPLSDRLLSLDAQAHRRIAAPVALAARGRLSDFGHEIGGVIARAPDAVTTGLEAAAADLDRLRGNDVEALLNQGHLWLSRNEPQQALASFERARQLAPENPLGYLGLGLAEFLADEPEAAEANFRRAAELDPASLAARLNLAMTLDELGQDREAAELWQALLDHPELTDAERQAIRARLQQGAPP